MDDKEWAEIQSFLQSLNYEQYAEGFQDNGYDLWEIVYDLTIDDLKSIGIKHGHAIRINKQLALKKIAITTPSPTIPIPKCPPSTTTGTTTTIKVNSTTPMDQNRGAIQTPIYNPSQQSNGHNLSHNSHPNALSLSTVNSINSPIERARKLQEQFHRNALVAEGIKNQMFVTMTRVLNGLQQELIQYNGKFADPINEMNQRIEALQKMDVQSLQRSGIWDCSSALFEPMMRNVVE